MTYKGTLVAIKRDRGERRICQERYYSGRLPTGSFIESRYHIFIRSRPSFHAAIDLSSINNEERENTKIRADKSCIESGVFADL